MKQQELELPFENVIGNVGSQAYAKATYSRGNDIMLFKIPFNEIQLWDGYNARTVFEDIEELADNILQHGQKTPFKLVTLKDGRSFLVRGYRRHRAYQLLIEHGKFSPETEVQFELTSTKETLDEMILDLYLSNNMQKSLKPIDMATVAWRLKHLVGNEKSNEEVAKAMSVSRQTVDNLIIIYEAPDDIKNEIRQGNMSMTDAVSFIRRQRKDKKEADKKEQDSHHTSMDAAPLPKDELAADLKELASLEQDAEDCKAAEENRKRQALENLYAVANEVLCNKEALEAQLGKKLAKDAVSVEVIEVLDKDSGELIPTDKVTVVLTQETEITENTIDDLINAKVGSVFIYKQHEVVKSVITEQPAEREKGKYDLSRPELEKMNKAIQGADKIEAIVSKLDVPDQVKGDISYQVHWLQENLNFCREWIHLNKKK